MGRIMKRPNRKDYIQKASIIELLADLEMYIDYLEAQCNTCKNKGSIAYWHKTGMGIKPCKCRKTDI
mgnify:FL=1